MALKSTFLALKKLYKLSIFLGGVGGVNLDKTQKNSSFFLDFVPKFCETTLAGRNENGKHLRSDHFESYQSFF